LRRKWRWTDTAMSRSLKSRRPSRKLRSTKTMND